MHLSSMQHMQVLISRYLQHGKSQRVVDIGSYDINGSYRQYFDDPAWQYTGADLEAGPSVDVVLESSYILSFKSSSVDVLVSGQTIEHMDFFWVSWLEMVRVVAPGGLIFLLALLSRRLRGALARWVGVEPLEITIDWEPHEDETSEFWRFRRRIPRRPGLGMGAAQAIDYLESFAAHAARPSCQHASAAAWRSRSSGNLSVRDRAAPACGRHKKESASRAIPSRLRCQVGRRRQVS